MSDPDARHLNWRFVAPNEPDRLLLLPVSGERVPGAIVPEPRREALRAALRSGPYPAVVAPDLGGWAKLADSGSPARLLRRLASRVAPEGWLYVGLANPWYPAGPWREGSMGAARAGRILRTEGLVRVERWLLFPDQRCPAYLVSADGRPELDYLLTRLFLPYVGQRKDKPPRMLQRALLVMRSVAVRTPHRLRAALVPAVGLVARRR